MNNVLTLRRSLNLTQESFAEYCNLSVISICRYESGEPISSRNAKKIAKACDVSVDYVLGLDDMNAIPRKIIFTVEEERVITDYRKLSRQRKNLVRNLLEELTMNNK